MLSENVKFMKPSILFAVLCVILGAVCTVAIGYESNLSRIDKLTTENERLRLFNAREVRRYKRPHAKVNWEACENGDHATGAPANLIAAIWAFENGPPDIETGVLGKTDAISKCAPMSDWPALETGRTLNKYAWLWLTTTKEGNQSMTKILNYMSKPYTAMPNHKEWAKGVEKNYKRFSKERDGK